VRRRAAALLCAALATGTAGFAVGHVGAAEFGAPPPPFTITTIITFPRPPPPPAAADLAISKSDSPDPVFVGQTLTYTVGVVNRGGGTARAVKVVDTLPPSVNFGSASSTRGTCGFGAGAVTCDVGTTQPFPSGDSFSVTITVTPTQEGLITNTATVTSSTTPNDPNKGNNTATEQTTVRPMADVALSKVDAPDPLHAGETLTYTLTATNNGPSAASGVTVSDTLTAGVTFLSSAPSCSRAGVNLTCALGSIANGASASLTVSVRPSNPGSITNTASASGDQVDQTPANNNAKATTRVRPAADLAVTKTNAPDPVGVDDELVYAVTVQNKGPNASLGTEVVDQLPSSVAFVAVTTTKGSCSHQAGKVACSIGTLADDSVVKVKLTVRPQTPGTIVNHVHVTGTRYDPMHENDSAEASTTAVGAGIAVGKIAVPDSVRVGATFTYTVTVQNFGDAAALNTTLVDPLPAKVAFQSVSTDRGSCSHVDGKITCDLGSLGQKEKATVTIVVGAAGAGRIDNTASAASTTFDPDKDDNSATAIVTVAQRRPPPRHRAPKLTVTPPIGPPGFVTLATGTGFPRGATVILVWRRGLGTTTVQADRNGRFDVFVLILPRDSVGPRLLVALPGRLDAFRATSARFLVVPSPQQPPNFAERR
jgi:uncharacterized repeat protein (TIGR01451 family)